MENNLQQQTVQQTPDAIQQKIKGGMRSKKASIANKEVKNGQNNTNLTLDSGVSVQQYMNTHSEFMEANGQASPVLKENDMYRKTRLPKVQDKKSRANADNSLFLPINTGSKDKRQTGHTSAKTSYENSHFLQNAKNTAPNKSIQLGYIKNQQQKINVLASPDDYTITQQVDQSYNNLLGNSKISATPKSKAVSSQHEIEKKLFNYHMVYKHLEEKRIASRMNFDQFQIVHPVGTPRAQNLNFNSQNDFKGPKKSISQINNKQYLHTEHNQQNSVSSCFDNSSFINNQSVQLAQTGNIHQFKVRDFKHKYFAKQDAHAIRGQIQQSVQTQRGRFNTSLNTHAMQNQMDQSELMDDSISLNKSQFQFGFKSPDSKQKTQNSFKTAKRPSINVNNSFIDDNIEEQLVKIAQKQQRPSMKATRQSTKRNLVQIKGQSNPTPDQKSPQGNNNKQVLKALKSPYQKKSPIQSAHQVEQEKNIQKGQDYLQSMNEESQTKFGMQQSFKVSNEPLDLSKLKSVKNNNPSKFQGQQIAQNVAKQRLFKKQISMIQEIAGGSITEGDEDTITTNFQPDDHFIKNKLPKIMKDKFHILMQRRKKEFFEQFHQDFETKIMMKFGDILTKEKNHQNQNKAQIEQYIQSLENQTTDTHMAKDIRQTLTDMFKKSMTQTNSNKFYRYIKDLNQQKFNSQVMANNFKEKINFIDLCKDASNPMAHKKYDQEPEYHYFQNCLIENNLALPLLQKVAYETLILYDYTLDKGQCGALAQACEYINNHIKAVLFDNCGIDDLEFSLILSGLESIPHFKSIIYRNNEFGQNSVQALRKILKKTAPYNLEQLELYNCRIRDNAIIDLIGMLRQNSKLSELVLHRVQFNDESTANFVVYIKKARRLTQLDLSWCEITSKNVEDILSAISQNRNLQELNLSWNCLIKNAQQEQEKFDLAHLDEIGSFQRKRIVKLPTKGTYAEDEIANAMGTIYNKTLLFANQDMIEASEHGDSSTDYDEHGKIIKKVYFNKCCKKELNAHEQKVSDEICNFIKYSQKLVHLNLTDCNLSHNVIIKILIRVNKSVSLQAVHLSNNPGINTNIYNCVKKFMDIKFFKKPKNLMNIHSLVNKKNLEFKEQKHQIEEGTSDMTFMQKNQLLQQRIQDQCRLAEVRDVITRKRIFNVQTSAKDPQQKIFILTRKLGHKHEMHKSTKWILYNNDHNDCWICDRKTFTLIFWNEEIGKLIDRKDKDIKDQIVMQLKFSRIGQEKIQCKEPTIFGTFNNYTEQKMMTIQDFCNSIDKYKPNFLEQIKQDPIFKVDPNIEDPSKLPEKLQHDYKKLVEQHYQGYKQTFPEVIKRNIAWQKPNIVNSEYYEKFIGQGQLYVFPLFSSAIQNFYLIRNKNYDFPNQNGEPQIEYYMHNYIGHFRIEPVPNQLRKFKMKTVQRVFKKHNSVFATWKEDDDNVIRQCFHHDQHYWKLVRVLGMNKKEEIQKIEDLIQQNMGVVKEWFIGLCCSSKFPYIQYRDIEQWVENHGLLDDKFTKADFEIKFSSTNYEENEVQNNPDRMLVRFEFFELLVRIAKQKYQFNEKKFTHTSEAFQYLIDDVLKPQHPGLAWQSFRTDHLWKLHVDDVFKANKHEIQMLFNANITDEKKKYITLRQCRELFITKSEIFPNHNPVDFCFGMSKMTLAREVEKKDEYFRMEHVEFLEMIGRAAQMKFNGSELEHLELARKIEFILDDLLYTMDIERNDVMIEDDDYEVSDDDSDY